MIFQSAAFIFHNVIRGTLIWQLSLCYGKGDHEEVCRLIRVACTAILATATLAIPLAILLSPQITSFLGLQDPWKAELQVLIPAVLSVAFLSGINHSLLALITAYQKAGQAAIIQSLGGVLTSMIAIAMLLSGFGMPSLLVGMLAASIAVATIAHRAASRLLGNISILPALPTRADIGLLGPFAFMLLITNITVLSRDPIDKFLAASMGGLYGIADLSLASRLASLSLQVSAVMLTPFTAAAGALWGRNDWTGCVRLYERIGLLVAIAAGMAAFLTHVLRAPLLTLWVGETRSGAYPYLTLLLVAGFLAIAYSGIGVSMAKAMGRPGIETEYALVTLVLVLATKPLLAGIAGPVGAVASSTISWGIGSAYLAYIVMTRLHLPPQMIYSVNRVVIVTLGLLLVASPRIGDALPMVTTRVQAAGLLVVMIPILGALYSFALLTTKFVFDWIAPVPHRTISAVVESQLSSEGNRHARAA